MEILDSHTASGSLQIASDVIEKIATQAALEVDGVAEVRPLAAGSQSVLGRVLSQKPIVVEVSNDVADLEVSIVVRYGTKIPEICEKVQENVKNSIQNMTNIAVGRVNIMVTGLAAEKAAS